MLWAIVTIAFVGCGWTALEMRGFAQALPLFSQLEKLDLGNNNLADEGVELLAKWLPPPFFIRHPSALD